MEDQNYVEEGYEDYAEDQQYEDYSNMGDGTELSKGEFSSENVVLKSREILLCIVCPFCECGALRNELKGEISNLFILQVLLMLTLSWMISSMPISASMGRDCLHVASVTTRAKIDTMCTLISSPNTCLMLTSRSNVKCAIMCVPAGVLTGCI